MKDPYLTLEEKKVVSRMKWRQIIIFCVTIVCLVAGFWLVIVAVDDEGMDASKIVSGLALLLGSALGVHLCGPLTKAERDVHALLFPEDVESDEERIERIATNATTRRRALSFSMWTFFAITVMSIWALGNEYYYIAGIPFVLGALCGLASEFKTKNEMECLKAQKLSENVRELDDFRKTNESFLRPDIEISITPYVHKVKRWGMGSWEINRKISFSRGLKDFTRLDSECLETRYGMFRTLQWENYTLLEVEGEEPVLYIQ